MVRSLLTAKDEFVKHESSRTVSLGWIMPIQPDARHKILCKPILRFHTVHILNMYHNALQIQISTGSAHLSCPKTTVCLHETLAIVGCAR